MKALMRATFVALACALTHANAVDPMSLSQRLGVDREARLLEGARKEGEVNVYTSLGLTNATMDGQPMVLYAQQELGRRVYWADVSIPAGATRTIVVDLGGQLPAGSSYVLDVARQPTVGADALSVHVSLADGWQVAATSASLAASSTTAAADIAQEQPMSFVVHAKKSG